MLSSLGRSVRLDPSLHLRHHYFRYEAIPYDPHRLPGDVGRAGPVGPCARLAPDFHWVWHPRRRQIWILRGIQEVSTETAHKQKSSCCSHLLVVFDLAHTHYYVRSLSIACQIPLHCIALHYQAQHVSPHSLHCTTRHNTFVGVCRVPGGHRVGTNQQPKPIHKLVLETARASPVQRKCNPQGAMKHAVCGVRSQRACQTKVCIRQAHVPDMIANQYGAPAGCARWRR